MMYKLKRIMTIMAVAAFVALPASSAWASSVSFNSFKFTTIPEAEAWQVVATKQKVDSEQNWYVTLTSKSNLDSKEARALVISNDSDPYMEGISPYPLYSYTTSSGAIAYHKTVYKGHAYNLYVSGNENISKKYTITLSGRYSS